MVKLNYYSGIGSRNVPEHMEAEIEKISQALHLRGYILRSGGANGCDLAFERRAGQRKQIFLPWADFNKSDSELILSNPIPTPVSDIASLYHPAWDRLSQQSKCFMSRNVYQVLGETLDDPVDFVVCYTEDGCESHAKRTRKTGGTGQAISIASELGIRVYNIANTQSLVELWILIDNL
jgi:hypothetical protein